MVLRRTRQGKQVEATKNIHGKRVDLVVAFDGVSLLLDSKCQKPLSHGEDGAITYGLERSEVDKLKATAKEFGMEAAVIFWDRTAKQASYVIDLVGRLNLPTTISERPALAAMFLHLEISSVALFT